MFTVGNVFILASEESLFTFEEEERYRCHMGENTSPPQLGQAQLFNNTSIRYTK
jgi:hypothetical protein